MGSVYEISKVGSMTSGKKIVMKLSTHQKSIENEVRILKEIRKRMKENLIQASNVPAIFCNGMFELSSPTLEETEVSFYVMKKYD